MRCVAIVSLLACIARVHACCKSAFIAAFNLTSTAKRTDVYCRGLCPNKTTMLTLDEARREHVLSAMRFVPTELMDDPHALRLEFGVRNGVMMNFMSTRRHLGGEISHSPFLVEPGQLHWDGFDSFQGLPKSTRNAAQLGWHGGKYSVQGKLPSMPSHVRLHVGWFNDTVPPFLASDAGRGPVAFAHLDADIYASTITVLDALGAHCRLRNGTVLAFDEIFGPPKIQHEELRALQEASATHGLQWRFITFLNHPRTNFGRAAVQITAPPPCVTRAAVSGQAAR